MIYQKPRLQTSKQSHFVCASGSGTQFVSPYDCKTGPSPSFPCVDGNTASLPERACSVGYGAMAEKNACDHFGADAVNECHQGSGAKFIYTWMCQAGTKP